jgi:hypothetical protein
LQYPNFFVDKTAGTITEKGRKKYGWHSTREKKEQLMGILRRAYAHGGVINHSGEALDEALTYVYYTDGGLGPAEFTKESEAARLTHGDRVIADALILLGVEDMPQGKPDASTPPGRSIGFRRKMALSRSKATRPGWGDTVDFTGGDITFYRSKNRLSGVR